MASTKFISVDIDSGQQKTINFENTILNAGVAVQGYYVDYGGRDHHVLSLDVSAAIASQSGSQLTVKATCEMRDGSNNVARGSVTVLAIAYCDG
ncbi:hypothetical protein [Coleofasciculus sp. G2-EDA-02]|uniref:hypothetical protein n=1 Tax=Coleofasciculus sp. G2-EDA-02 TaxID=3069529 RepID=UPI0032FE8436